MLLVNPVDIGKPLPITYSIAQRMQYHAQSYMTLASLNLDINNKIQLQHTILYGTDTNQEQLLKFIFKFLTDTQRFV